MTRAQSSVSRHSLAPRQQSPSEVHELRRQAPTVRGMIDSGNAVIFNAGLTGGFVKIHGILDEVWNRAASPPNQAFDFIKAAPGTSYWGVLEPKTHAGWRTVKWRLSPIEVCSVLHDIGHQLLRVSNDPPFSAHEDIRTSNLLLACSADPTPLKRTAEEKRYKELNAKYYAGTLTSEETVELARVEAELDEADAVDPHLIQFTAKVDEGYDKLEVGLKRINGILDELLKD